MQNKNKIFFDINKISKTVNNFRKKGNKIVLTQGSFDMIHVGHARYCAQAKKHGDILIVAVDSDEKVKKRKGKNRPIVPQNERLEILTYLKSVEMVFLKELDLKKWELIKAIKPDVLVATKETYSQKQIDDLHKFCGKVIVLDPMATTSTSAKLRLVQIGAAKKIQSTLTNKLINTIEEVLGELKN